MHGLKHIVNDMALIVYYVEENYGLIASGHFYKPLHRAWLLARERVELYVTSSIPTERQEHHITSIATDSSDLGPHMKPSRRRGRSVLVLKAEPTVHGPQKEVIR
jgi:hypothetical protein